jgi:hypothetical protein
MAINPIRIPIVAFDLTKVAFRAVNKAMGFLQNKHFQC